MSDLVGAWRLVDFHIHFDDGRPSVEPFGPGAQGLLVYSADGWMSAILSRADRPGLDVPRLEAAHRATDTSKARAFDGYLSYGGRWRIEGDTVVHTVQWALVPDIVGREQRRRFRFADGLVLAYRGGARTYQLRWREA